MDTGGRSNLFPMSNSGTGMGGVRHFAMVVTMAEYVAPELRERCRAQAIERLALAIVREADARRGCRDLDVAAATRVRSWCR